MKDFFNFLVRLYRVFSPMMFIAVVMAIVVFELYHVMNTPYGGVLWCLFVVHSIISIALTYFDVEYLNAELEASYLNSAAILIIIGMCIYVSPMPLGFHFKTSMVAGFVVLCINYVATLKK